MSRSALGLRKGMVEGTTNVSDNQLGCNLIWLKYSNLRRCGYSLQTSATADSYSLLVIRIAIIESATSSGYLEERLPQHLINFR